MRKKISNYEEYDYESLEDFQPKEEKLESPLKIMREVFKRAGTMALSFTYSAELPILLAMLGRVGNSNNDHTQSLAAATLSITLLDTAVNISVVSSYAVMFEGSRIYGQMIHSYTLGEEKIIYKKALSRILKNSLLLASPFVFSSMLALYFSEFILVNWFGQNVEISNLSQQFLRPAAFLIPLYSVRLSQKQILFIHKKQKWMTIISLVSFFSFGFFLANGLGFGHFSLPNMATQGIFLGVMSENIFSTLGVSACLFDPFFKDYHFCASFLSYTYEDWQQFKVLAQQGIPLVITYLSELSTLFCKSILAGMLGSDQLAAQNFSGQIGFFALFLAHAFSQATVLCIGETTGSNRVRFAQYGLMSSLLASIFPCALVMGYPQILTITLGGSVSNEVMSLAHILIPLAGGTAVFYTGALTMLQSLRMTVDHIKPTVVFNSWLWFSILAGYLLGFSANLGVIGVGVGSLAGTGLGAAHLFLFWKRAYNMPSREESTDKISVYEQKKETCEQQKLVEVNKSDSLLSSDSKEGLPRVSSSWATCFQRVISRWRNSTLLSRKREQPLLLHM